MAYLPELHYCAICKTDLGTENGDGICGACDAACEQVGDYYDAKLDELREEIRTLYAKNEAIASELRWVLSRRHAHTPAHAYEECSR